MNKIIKAFVVLFGVVSIFFGLEQLTFKNTIFADSKMCCNNYNYNPLYGGLLCSSSTTADTHDDGKCDGDDSIFNLQTCLDKMGLGEICYRSAQEYHVCMTNDGYRYSTLWGLEIPVNITYISGPMFLDYGQNGQFTCNIEDIINAVPPLHYQWYIYYPCYGSKAAPCGSWLKIGNDSYVFNTSQTKDFWVKCQVTAGRAAQGNFSTDISPIKEVYVGGAKSKELSSKNDLILNLTNYPNPFNPTTTISYNLNKTTIVMITVYNNNGEKVVELVNEIKNAGFHEVEFDASKLSSGIYYYSIKTDYSSKINRMLLLK